MGLVAFAAPFLGCAAVARFLVGWNSDASWLAGIALSTTSVAVVYAVMLEFGLNRTEYGKIVLAACFVNDLATVLMLGLKFSPFSLRTLAFAGGSAVTFFIMPWLVPRFFRRYGGRPSELEAKLLLLTMFGLGALALWAGTEPVLAAYILGMILAGTVGKDHALVRRLRTLTFGLTRTCRWRPAAFGGERRCGCRAGKWRGLVPGLMLLGNCPTLDVIVCKFPPTTRKEITDG